MPAPRVFISSTCYDLRHIRENLKFFVRTFGYEPVLSEDGGVFYDPHMHVHEACLTEVPSCQILVLIIGGRYGSAYKNLESSITNEEYKSAVKAKIPIFALVERGVLDDYRVYKANVNNPDLDATTIKYPAADSIKIFGFIDEVQSQVVNNALVPFADFEEMRVYLIQQWASMLYRFLTTEGEAKRTGDILEALGKANERIEFLSRTIIASVGDRIAKATVRLYDLLLQYEVVSDFRFWRISVSPHKILRNSTLDEFCRNKIQVNSFDDEYSIAGGGPPYMLSQERYDSQKAQYQELRSKLLKTLEEEGIRLEDFLASEESSVQPSVVTSA